LYSSELITKINVHISYFDIKTHKNYKLKFDVYSVKLICKYNNIYSILVGKSTFKYAICNKL